jgi:hypothetical protein
MIRRLVVTLGFLAAAAASAPAQEDADCMLCHGERSATGTRRGRTISIFVDAKKHGRSIHAATGCVGCHADLAGAEFPHAEEPARVECGTCHTAVLEIEKGSLHAVAEGKGDPLAPTCVSCHGKHDIVRARGPGSPVAPLQVPALCGRCHREGSAVMKTRAIHQDSVLENYSESIHGEGLLRKGLIVAPTCASCHTAHNIRKHSDPASSIARKNIAATCATCHAQIEAVHRKVIRGELWEKEIHVLPACVDCHQPHKVRRAFYTQGMSDKDCMRCHAQPGIKAASDGRSLHIAAADTAGSRHAKIACSQCHSEVNASRVRACETITKKVDCTACHAEVGTQFRSSTHGVLASKNDPNGPTCKECHGTHGVRGKADPVSPIFATRIPQLCARCHREGEKAAVRYKGGQHEIIEHYTESIHGKGLMKSGLTVTATCTNCHTAHGVLPKDNPASSVNRSNVPATCGQCHHGIGDQFRSSVHYRKAG